MIATEPAMIQFFSTAARALAPRLPAADALTEAERWRRDPLSHPALRAMSQRELADLPIGHPALPKRLIDGICR